MELQKLSKYDIKQATVKFLVDLSYDNMEGEIGYDDLDFLLEVAEVDWDYCKKITGHDFYNELLLNPSRYEKILDYICQIQMVDYNKVAYGVKDGYYGRNRKKADT